MKLLHIQSSPNTQTSLSREVSNYLVSKIKASNVTQLDLATNPLPHLSITTVGAFFTPENDRSSEQVEAIKLSDKAVDEFLNSDVIVISTPMWNFGVPSNLKAWFDHISRAGKTFSYSPEGLKGLAGGRKIYLVVSSGSVFSEGPYAKMDMLTPWFTTALGFLGITDLEVIRVEGTNSPEAAANAVTKAKAQVDTLIR